MTVVWIMSIFYCIYGILGLFGIQNIADKYIGKSCTDEYIRFRGVSWLILGVPWLILCIASRYIEIDRPYTLYLLIGLAVPSLIYSFVGEHKYKAMLKKEKTEHNNTRRHTP